MLQYPHCKHAHNAAFLQRTIMLSGDDRLLPFSKAEVARGLAVFFLFFSDPEITETPSSVLPVASGDEATGRTVFCF